ncbi:hypothetical protein [Microvirga aerophila]|jgi:hypothetical protein|uniref:Uncharacterized protein n=1 Tax=Microvirga aerophila TaxID=670291 RepID=A0A512C2M0_9HYPH|nr:hypothetical protein [Microvirga aerophila]GEO18464.1 hypothetical protein MAE02_61600 [Microvirga aerophila]
MRTARVCQHAWSNGDDLVNCFAYLYGTKPLGENDFRIATMLGITTDSWAMRKSNFSYLDTGKGYSNVAKQSFETWVKWGKPVTAAKKAAHLQAALDYLATKSKQKG